MVQELVSAGAIIDYTDKVRVLKRTRLGGRGAVGVR